MAYRYSDMEYHEMARVYYDEANSNLNATVKLYREFSVPILRNRGITNPRVPHPQTVHAVVQRLREWSQVRQPLHAIANGRPTGSTGKHTAPMSKKPVTGSTTRIARDRQKGLGQADAIDSKLIKKPSQESTDDEDSSEDEEAVVPGSIICAICRKFIDGFLYMCVQCVDYSLCGLCEARAHPEHYVLRVPLNRAQEEAYEVIKRVRKDVETFLCTVAETPAAYSPNGKIEEENDPLQSDRPVLATNILEQAMLSIGGVNENSEPEVFYVTSNVDRKPDSTGKKCSTDSLGEESASCSYVNVTKPQSSKPDASHSKPDALHTKPDALDFMSAASRYYTDALHSKPDASDFKPAASRSMRDPSHSEPDTSHVKPAASRANPDALHSKPDGSHHKPDALHSKPDASDFKPAASRSMRDASHSEPDTSHVKPAASRANPDVLHSKPDASHIKIEVKEESLESQITSIESHAAPSIPDTSRTNPDDDLKPDASQFKPDASHIKQEASDSESRESFESQIKITAIQSHASRVIPDSSRRSRAKPAGSRNPAAKRHKPDSCVHDESHIVVYKSHAVLSEPRSQR